MTYETGIHGSIQSIMLDPDTGSGMVSLRVTCAAADSLKLGANVVLLQDPGRCEECYARPGDLHATSCPYNTFPATED